MLHATSDTMKHENTQHTQDARCNKDAPDIDRWSKPTTIATSLKGQLHSFVRTTLSRTLKINVPNYRFPRHLPMLLLIGSLSKPLRLALLQLPEVKLSKNKS